MSKRGLLLFRKKGETHSGEKGWLGGSAASRGCFEGKEPPRAGGGSFGNCYDFRALSGGMLGEGGGVAAIFVKAGLDCQWCGGQGKVLWAMQTRGNGLLTAERGEKNPQRGQRRADGFR